MPPASSLGPWRFVGGCRAEVTSRIANVTQCRVTRVSWVLLRAPGQCPGHRDQEKLPLEVTLRTEIESGGAVGTGAGFSGSLLPPQHLKQCTWG